MLDVIFYEAFDEEEKALRKFLPAKIKAKFTWKTIQESCDDVSPAAVISTRTQSRIPSSWSAQIKGVLTRSQGFDHLWEAREILGTHIVYGYLIDYCARAVAEHAVLTMMALLRRLRHQIKNFKIFKRDDITGLECLNRKALVIGVGNIGQQLVKICEQLEMRVQGVDIVKRKKDLKYVSLREGIRWADVVFCAAPLDESTRGMLNYQILKRARKGLIFINIARAEISPIEDLKKAMDQGIVGGLSLDVYPKENIFANKLRSGKHDFDSTERVIWQMKDDDNVILTPHNAFNTSEALERKAKQSVDALMYFLKKKTFPNTIS